MPDPSPEPARDHPFYVETDCCVTCGVPEHIAPELFRTEADGCIVLRQPESIAEIDKVVEIMWSAEFGCIRYGGGDGAILKRLGEADMTEFADDERADAFPALDRDRVVFALPSDATRPFRSSALAAAFRDHLRQQERYALRWALDRRKVSFAWSGTMFHSITFTRAPGGRKRMAILRVSLPSAHHGMAGRFHEWLTAECGAVEIAWHTADGLSAGEDGFRRPY